jgi:iron complex transport system substrate-binding protein
VAKCLILRGLAVPAAVPHTLSAMERIASLLPSTTEIVCALGLESALVGRSHECDYPASVETLPVLTAPKLDPNESSAEIDRSVKELVRDGLSVYRVDVEKLRELAPTVILTQDQCDVCAVSLADVENALADWIGERPRVISLEPASLGDVWNDVKRVADALGVTERGREVVKALAERVADVAERTLRIKAQPTVACVEWIDPLMAAGNWMPDLVALAGGHCLFGESGAHSPWMSWDELRAADPDVIVVLPCGFDLARTRAEMGPLRDSPGFGDLRAVREGRVVLTDGNQYFNRPGPRLADSLEILAEILHPDEFAANHRGTAWEVFES